MLEIHRILVPIDFSEHAAAALDAAISLAKPFGARIDLLHCYQIHVGGVSPYGLVIPESLDREVREAAEREPACLQMILGARAEELGADLIVMGTRGLTGLRHVLLGSVAERTLRMAPCPVLTLKAPAED